MEQYFLANDIKEEKEKRAILLSVCGSKTYTLIWDLLQPGKPANTGLEDIPKKVGKHYSPKPSGTLQIPQPKTSARGKRVRVYRGFRKLTEHCNFGETLDDMMRDRLVCGIKDEKVQRRLLADPDLKYKRAVELALAFELVSKNTLDLNTQVKEEETPVHRVNNPQGELKCYRCGGKHWPKQCRFCESKCHDCDETGHSERMCRGKKKANDNEPARNEQPKHRREPTHLPEEDWEADEKSGEYSMYNITNGSASEAWTVDIELCGKPHHMEIDSGATKTVISQVTYDAIRDTVDLMKSNSVLST